MTCSVLVLICLKIFIVKLNVGLQRLAYHIKYLQLEVIPSLTAAKHLHSFASQKQTEATLPVNLYNYSKVALVQFLSGYFVILNKETESVG
jgi:hypothetical protein